ncbi:polyhydroxyalkanoic acid system family protein [Sphingomonas sp. A2-49]|uniref:polyhydroxyalkanoic acid system family protein n=1 Tax=Sphingomonas sp. A2-49 TaxID=1391375 RepID=UPI0021D38306|nr:polyhydroxyalkanoic acid system family protein [Sphingomonas sp. A2-49]MCU6454707.1 polyhydroxyalkanoic acid system family protein [Sphingomonas sp. A2-49]
MATIPFDIPHDLGRDEARRRIEAGLPKLAQHIPGGGTVDADWTGPDTLALAIVAMGQRVAVDMTVAAASVAGTVRVPMMLAMMSGPIADFVRTSAEKMLARPA